jgi:hypothetical protein
MAMPTAASAPTRGTKKSAAPMTPSVIVEPAHQRQGTIISGQRMPPRIVASAASVAKAVGSGARPKISAGAKDRPISGAING